MGIDELLLAALFAVVIVGSGFVQTLLGFGYAIVALAVLPYAFDVRLANLVVSISILIPLAASTWFLRHEIDWRALRHAIVGALVGLPLGLIVFTSIDGVWLLRATGLLILISCIDGLRPATAVTGEHRTSRLYGGLAGLASGILSGSVGVGGPPMVAYAVRQPWQPGQLRAFVMGFSLVLSSARAVMLTASGFVDGRVLMLALAAIPFGFLGSRLAHSAVRYVRPRQFRYALLTLLAASSLGMLLHRREPQVIAASVVRHSSGESERAEVFKP